MEGLSECGAVYDQIFLHTLNITPCQGCMTCQNIPGEYGCAVRDDMQNLLGTILEADVLVFATPIYTWQATPPLKAVMDRMFGLNKFYGTAPREAMLSGKTIALIATCGYKPERGADLLDEAVRRYCKHSEINYGGMYAVQDVNGIEDFTTEAAVEGAKQFARDIVASLGGV